MNWAPGRQSWRRRHGRRRSPNVVTSINRHELTAVAQRDLLLVTDASDRLRPDHGRQRRHRLPADTRRDMAGRERAPAQAQLPRGQETTAGANLRVVRQTLQRLRVVEDAPLDVEAIAKGAHRASRRATTSCDGATRWCSVTARRYPINTTGTAAGARRRRASRGPAPRPRTDAGKRRPRATGGKRRRRSARRRRQRARRTWTSTTSPRTRRRRRRWPGARPCTSTSTSARAS